MVAAPINPLLPPPIPLWRNRDYVLLWCGQPVNVVGTQVSQIAHPLLVLTGAGNDAPWRGTRRCTDRAHRCDGDDSRVRGLAARGRAADHDEPARPVRACPYGTDITMEDTMTEAAESGRQRIFSGGAWEDTVGYARAVRVGQFVYVSGTTATGPGGELLGGNDPEAQAIAAIEKIGRALNEAGATFADVVRTRIYVTNADDSDAVGRAHARFFMDVRPANTLVEVSRLIGDEYLVEIEADAVIGSGGSGG